MKPKKEQRTHKIISRVSESEYERLESIASKMNMKSVYQVINFANDCFLKAMNYYDDVSEEPVDDRILRMFPIDYLKKINSWSSIIKRAHSEKLNMKDFPTDFIPKISGPKHRKK